MKIENAVYKAIDKADWSDLPIKAGTPVNIGGYESNDSAAIGIVTQTVTEKPLIPVLAVLVGGDVDQNEIEALYGSSLSADAMSNMNGIKFFGKDMTPSADPVYVLPKATNSRLGGVIIGEGLAVTSAGKIFVSPSETVAKASGNAPTKAEFDALIDALIAAKLMKSPTV